MKTLIWETARPYFYLRTTKDGRVLIGGEDDNFDSPRRRDARVGKKSKKLVKRFETMFPEVKLSVAYNWAGRLEKPKMASPTLVKQAMPKQLFCSGLRRERHYIQPHCGSNHA